MSMIIINTKFPQMTPDAPRLVHLSLASQESIVSSLAKTATTVERLRRFTIAVFKRSLSQSESRFKRAVTTRTCEAFADAIDHTVRGLDFWCAAREEAISRACCGVDEVSLVISLLSIEKAIRDEFETSLEVLLEIVQMVFGFQCNDDFESPDSCFTRQSPDTLTALLLDTLFIGIQQHMERRDTVTSDALMRVFVQTAEPIWGMIGKWLREGMGLSSSVCSGGNFGMADELDDEFFIESNGVGVGMMALGLLDPEFWNEGYALREGVALMGDSVTGSEQRRKAIPLFLEHVAELVLSTGKAVGLVRALGGPPLANSFDNWRTFADLVSSETHDSEGGVEQKSAGLFSVSVDTLSHLIYDGLLAHCQVTGAHLVNLLVDDCQLLWHMRAIEGFFLMRKGDAMSHFTDILFIKVSIGFFPLWSISQVHLLPRWIIHKNLGPIFT
jgi:gamma-tubulin complex component 5